jgi:hypothetical protein
VTQFQLGKFDVARDSSGPVGFAESVRAFIAGTFFLQTEETTRPFALVDPYHKAEEGGAERGLVPPSLRDALFDARQSSDRHRRTRWALFNQLMQELEPELGSGEFDTAFERSTGRADLVFDTGGVTTPIDRLGAGVQRMAALVGSLVLARAMLVGFSEPELGLAPTAQQRLLIGLVDQLAEIEPGQLVGAASATARSPRPKAPESTPAAAPEAPPGTPPWKWQPNK